MGRATVKAIAAQENVRLAAAVDTVLVGEDAGDVAGIGKIRVNIARDLGTALDRSRADVMVDFTNPSVVMDNVRAALSRAVNCVVGTTGLGEDDLAEIEELCERHDTAAIVSPNFSLGANLMMRFAQEAAKHFEFAEILELHHEGKKDAPSGTALKTAAMMAEGRGGPLREVPTEVTKLAGARGGESDGVAIHSVRLPGLVAHQEIIFGGLGETLTIRHDSLTHESFMPGVLLAAHEVRKRKGLILSLDDLLK
ncbi:MAG: 4-hydroxy-tetrahydrodipicolinate reductase [Armatimonadota bacterium]